MIERCDEEIPVLITHIIVMAMWFRGWREKNKRVEPIGFLGCFGRSPKRLLPDLPKTGQRCQALLLLQQARWLYYIRGVKSKPHRQHCLQTLQYWGAKKKGRGQKAVEDEGMLEK
jgi:hypothetical protein